MIKNSERANADEIIALQKYALISAGQNFINSMKVASPHTEYTFIKGRHFACNQGNVCSENIYTHLPCIYPDTNYNDNFCLAGCNFCCIISGGGTDTCYFDIGCNRQAIIWVCAPLNSPTFCFNNADLLFMNIRSHSDVTRGAMCLFSCNRGCADYYLMCSSAYICSSYRSMGNCSHSCICFGLGNYSICALSVVGCTSCCIEPAKYEFCKIPGTSCYCYFKDDFFVCCVNPNFSTYKGFYSCGFVCRANCSMTSISSFCATCLVECFCSPYYLTCCLGEEEHDAIYLAVSGDEDNKLCYELLNSDNVCIKSLNKNDITLLSYPSSCYKLKIYNPLGCLNCYSETDIVTLNGFAITGVSRSPI